MKVQIIGTGNMSCKSFNASMMIDDNILVDAPPGICKHLINQDFDINNIDAIFITHQHTDHYFDLPVLIHYISTTKPNKNITLYANKNIIDSFVDLMKLAFPDVYQEKLDNVNFNFVILEEYKDYIYNDIKISVIPVTHGTLDNCFGLIFNKDNINLGYSGDASLTNEIENMCNICNLVIADCTNNIGNKDHLGLDNIHYLCKKYRDTTIYITHLSNKINKENIEKLPNLIIPLDGQIIEI